MRKPLFAAAMIVAIATPVLEREPRDRTTVIKKEDADGDRTKTIIHHDN